MPIGRLTETHEYFHRQLDDTTAFGGLIGVVAALAEALPTEYWTRVRRLLVEMSDLVHEMFAVGMSLLTTQRPIDPIPSYPTYDRHVRVAQRLVGSGTHPWVALAGLRSAATACMQSDALRVAALLGIAQFDPHKLPTPERPNHRLVALLASDYASFVEREDQLAETEHSSESWWQPSNGISLSPEAMDGAAAEAHRLLERRLIERAETIITSAGGGVVGPDEHHSDLRDLLTQARELAPAGLTRIGSLVEAPGGELLHGGPLDGQVLELSGAPGRAVVLPYGSASPLAGEGEGRHVLVVVTTPRRIRAAYAVEGVALPETEAVACVRSTVFDGERRDAVLLMPVDGPEQIAERDVPIYVSVLSSAAAAAPDEAAAWMRWADRARLSLVMDTPATAALRRWCAGGARFRTSTRLVRIDDDHVRFIVGRVEEEGGQSPLVVIPSTEFGARWLESAAAEDPVLRSAIVQDRELFEQESPHLDVVLMHLMLEERFVGTGSWRR